MSEASGDQLKRLGITLALEILVQQPGEYGIRRIRREQSLALDLSFISSGEPNISFADFPSTPIAASVHSTKRAQVADGPGTPWLRPEI